mgnify:FL=1
MNLPVYTNEECALAVNELKKHVNGKEVFSLKEPNIGLGITITEDLSKKMYRQSYYKDCVFDSAVCKSIGFSGSKFIDTVFRNCDLDGGNLHSCDFNNVTFLGDGEERHPMVNAGFHKGTFTECTFQNLYIFSCGFTDVVFYNTTFINCTIRLCSLENAQFQNCYFIDTDMSTLNLEYTEFDNIHAIQTIFPFITIPSAYGLLQQLSLSDNSNAVYTAANEAHKLSIPEYYALLKDFECYYAKKEKYYALANLYISQDMVMEGYEAIRAGIMKAIKTKDFRTLRHFCKLVYLSDIFTIRQRRNLFENIMKWVSNENLSLPEYHNYQLFAGHIREMLLNNDSHKPTLYFYLETNIEPDEPQKQVVLLTTIDGILTSCNVPSTSIEMRHNSAYVDFLTIICENIPQFSQVLIMIYGSLAGVTLIAKGIQKLVETGQTAVSNYDQHKLNKLELEKKKIEIEVLKQEQNYKKTMESIDYEKSLAELRKLTLEVEEMEKQAGKYRKILMDNGIEISVQHNSKNLKNAPFHELIHYNQ